MIKIYSLTRPIEEFRTIFWNGAEVFEKIDSSDCAYFWHKQQEVLIYDKSGTILFSCCWRGAFNRIYITSVWGNNERKYYHEIDYEAIECEIRSEAKVDKYRVLTEALRTAAESAKPFGDTEDGGTCNFDSLKLTLPRWNEGKTIAAIEDARLRGFTTRIFKTKVFVVTPPVARQGNARTRQAESMRDTMKSLGYDASVYYQMD